MQRFRGFGPLIAVAILGVIWLILAEPMARWISERRAAHNGMIIGRIVHAEGQARRIHGGDVELIPSPLNSPIDLRDGDRLQTSILAKAIFILNSGDEFEIPAGSALQLQLWNPRDANSPIYIVSSLGGLDLHRAGVRGKAFVVKEGRLYLPGQKPVQKAMALTVLRSAPLDLHLAETEKPAAGGEFEAADGAADEVALNSTLTDPETLSNEYIDETIVARQSQFQKCWLTRLKDSPGLKGQIVVQFEISRRGKVKEVRVADSTLQDETLQKCVVSVMERLVFRSYKGSEISLSYPINFE